MAASCKHNMDSSESETMSSSSESEDENLAKLKEAAIGRYRDNILFMRSAVNGSKNQNRMKYTLQLFNLLCVPQLHSLVSQISAGSTIKLVSNVKCQCINNMQNNSCAK